ncbi:Uncharacterised protein [Chlamydia abortus]|nr:Uncharacterised protein [Chlamydia abortus]
MCPLHNDQQENGSLLQNITEEKSGFRSDLWIAILYKNPGLASYEKGWSYGRRNLSKSLIYQRCPYVSYDTYSHTLGIPYLRVLHSM